MNQSSMEWLSILAIVLVLSVAFLVANQRDELKKQAVERGFALGIQLGNGGMLQNDCGATWRKFWRFGGIGIAAASFCAGDFIPQGRNRIKATPFIFG